MCFWISKQTPSENRTRAIAGFLLLDDDRRELDSPTKYLAGCTVDGPLLEGLFSLEATSLAMSRKWLLACCRLTLNQTSSGKIPMTKPEDQSMVLAKSWRVKTTLLRLTWKLLTRLFTGRKVMRKLCTLRHLPLEKKDASCWFSRKEVSFLFLTSIRVCFSASLEHKLLCRLVHQPDKLKNIMLHQSIISNVELCASTSLARASLMLSTHLFVLRCPYKCS
mmetsp:Transcript_31615/g.52176  ORF Transcript_31615/g.52176 Transcript_31615/m.52176 type:complete len:221 (+) Transcript_31615:4292-4954(+)